MDVFGRNGINPKCTFDLILSINMLLLKDCIIVYWKKKSYISRHLQGKKISVMKMIDIIVDILRVHGQTDSSECSIIDVILPSFIKGICDIDSDKLL